MSSEKFNIKWIQIIITAVITGLISLIVAIIVFNYTNEKTELVYEEFPPSSFDNNKAKVCILNYSFKNLGEKHATDVKFLISLPESSIIIEPNIKISNSLTEYSIKQPTDNSIIFKIESLYQNESGNISLLVENMPSNAEIKVELRSKEGIGYVYDQKEKSVSPTLIYITLILVIVLIVLFIVLLFASKRIIRAFKLFRKKLGEQSEIEEQKVRNIISQGVEYCDMGLIDDSIRVLIKGKYLHPESSSIHSNLARAFAKKGDFDKAEAEFRIAEKILIEDADKLIYNYTRAHYFAILNDKEKMIEHLKIAQELDRERVNEKMMLDEEFDGYKDDKEFQKISESKN